MWIWYPEGRPTQSTATGVRFFRTTVHIPEGRAVNEAVMRLTADNAFTLFVNGRKAAQGNDRRRVYRVDLKELLRPGENVLIVRAVNASDSPNPAGLIGRCRVVLDDGQVVECRTDWTWKASKRPAELETLDFNAADWQSVWGVALFGDAPWGTIGMSRPLTLSPVKADPFVGHFDLPAGWLDEGRVYLEAGEIEPEAAASATINGEYAGGFIGRPFRLEATSKLKPGRNTIEIQPFAPQSVRIVHCREGGVRKMSSEGSSEARKCRDAGGIRYARPLTHPNAAGVSCSCLWLAVASDRSRKGLSPPITHACSAHLGSATPPSAPDPGITPSPEALSLGMTGIHS
jgi:hypothetical protein